MLSILAVPLLLAAAAPARATARGEENPMGGTYGGRGAAAQCDGPQTYTVQYDMVWSGQTHPTEYPAGLARFSPFNTITHNRDVSLWSFGKPASEAIRLVAELGDGSGVEMVAEECADAGTCGGLVAPLCVAADGEASGVCTVEVDIEVSAEYPYVSVAGMIVPSPDWFTGLDTVSLCKDGKWVDFIEYTLYPLDAGTDSGLTFQSADLDTQPRSPITNLADVMPAELGQFYNPQEGETLPVGSVSFTVASAPAAEFVEEDNAEATRAERDDTRDERDDTRDERDDTRDERDDTRDERDTTRDERDTTRDERDDTRDERDSARDERDRTAEVDSTEETASAPAPADGPDRVGAVYVQTNDADANEIAAYGRMPDGTLYFIDNYATGGVGTTEFDGDEGLDPLIAADSVVVTADGKYLLTVNAGSDSIASFKINADYTLELVSTVPSGGVGPNSVAVRDDGLVFVTNIDRDGFALGDEGEPREEPNDEGRVVGFTLSDSGELAPTGVSVDLDNRPANIGFSTSGEYLLVSSSNSGSAALPGENAQASLSSFSVDSAGSLQLIDTGTSTMRGNDQGRNLPSAIDFDVSVQGEREFVVVTEAREFSPEGEPPAFPALQAGSVSVYELNADGSLTITEAAFTASPDATVPNTFGADGQQLTACWIDFASDGRTFYVTNPIPATISTFRLGADGTLELVEAVAAAGTSAFETPGEEIDGPTGFGRTDGFIDLSVSPNGEQLYVLAGLSGSVYVFDIAEDYTLSLNQVNEGELPMVDTQGLISV